LDHLNTLNDLTPKIRCQGRNGVDPNLIFGLDSKLFLDNTENYPAAASHNEEVEILTIYRGSSGGRQRLHDHNGGDCDCGPSVKPETDGHEPGHRPGGAIEDIEKGVLDAALETLSKESVWRVKGFVKLKGSGVHILNWAFGRFELTPLLESSGEKDVIRFTAMGERGEVKRAIRKFCSSLGAVVV
jgi:hypothetical protein